MQDDSNSSPFRPFYMVAVREVLDRCDPEEVEKLLQGARDVRSEYGDFDSLIAKLEEAKSQAR